MRRTFERSLDKRDNLLNGKKIILNPFTPTANSIDNKIKKN